MIKESFSRLEMTKARLELYFKAELAVLENQSYKIGSRAFTRADLAEIRLAIDRLEAQIIALENPTKKILRVIPRDL